MNNVVKRFDGKAWRWIGWGWPFIGLLMLVTAGIGAVGTVTLYNSEAEVQHSNEVYTGLERLLSLARDAESGQRGYVITGRDEYLRPYLQAEPQIGVQLDRLDALIKSNPVQERRLAQLSDLLDAKKRELSSVIELRRTQGFEPAQAIVLNDSGMTFMDHARAIVLAMEQDVAAQLVARQATARHTRDLAIVIGLASGALTVFLCLSFGYLARRMLDEASKSANSMFEQKELLEVTLTSIGDGVVATDADGRIAFFNRVAQALTGWRAAEAMRCPVDDVVRFERSRDKSRAENPALVAMRERRTVDHSSGTLLIGRDGTRTHVDANGAPTFDSSGRLVGSVLVLHDVTERERAEERFRVAVEAAPNAMIMVDDAGKMTLVNTQTERLFGYRRAELLGQSIEMLVPERFRGHHLGYRTSFFANPSARPMGSGRDLFGLRQDGSEFPIEIGLNPIETSEGTFVLSSIADITERKRAERQLRQRTEELARSNRDLEQFAYVASHDLQEPLRAVAGPLQLLQRRYEGKLDERADEFIGHAVDGATRMQTLIDDLLSYSRVGRLEDPKQSVEVAHALELALKNLAVVIQETQAQITHDALPTVQGIPTQLALLFQNLVGNGIKFRKKDGPVQIHVAAEPAGEAWQISVADNGIGIAEQYFERIFVIFQRLHTRREYPGTGLGLALCKRIVEHHGGRIWLESTPGEGTTFFFTLPRPAGQSAG
ncbi:PAS domain S-box protein [Trinickia sp. NRRL B-1857]|uniref:sensor histidine kinase n=1 Tax=Trinickia sp. NRRL B-1857 TaxID=3162879 RepID=UPI003D2A0ABF